MPFGRTGAHTLVARTPVFTDDVLTWVGTPTDPAEAEPFCATEIGITGRIISGRSLGTGPSIRLTDRDVIVTRRLRWITHRCVCFWAKLHVCFTRRSGPAVGAFANEAVDQVDALSPVQTRGLSTIINVCFTVRAAPPNWAAALIASDLVRADAAIHARRIEAIVEIRFALASRPALGAGTGVDV